MDEPVTPYEAGLGWAVKLNKGEFVGRAALLGGMSAGVWPDARAALDAAPDLPVLIDTSRVEYCDGGGIAMLVDLLRQLRRPEAQVSVAQASRTRRTASTKPSWGCWKSILRKLCQ